MHSILYKRSKQCQRCRRCIALNALNTVQKIKESNVEEVQDIETSHNRCLLKYVEDVKDRSNTHKGCNAMLCMSKMLKMHSIECIEYCTKDQSNVEDVEDA